MEVYNSEYLTVTMKNRAFKSRTSGGKSSTCLTSAVTESIAKASLYGVLPESLKELCKLSKNLSIQIYISIAQDITLLYVITLILLATGLHDGFAFTL